MFKEIFAGFDFSAFACYVDTGFIGIHKHVRGPHVYVPHKAARNRPLSAEQKQENTSQARIRAVVENAIAKIKSFFVLRVENRMRIKERLNEVVAICAGLANLKTEKLLKINQ